ncbi:MAG: hypothetical protein LBC82_01280 [Oscillospiraceae bacterium]|nr:hypothetical protein [Oscillospiraceae bacterium]
MRTIYKTTAFIEALLDHVNEKITCFYEDAPTEAAFPFGVISGVFVSDLDSGDALNFYISVYTDEKKPGATIELEKLCDTLRAYLSRAVIRREGAFSSHIGFDNQRGVHEAEFDLCHRRLTLTARIFYNLTGGITDEAQKPN